MCNDYIEQKKKREPGNSTNSNLSTVLVLLGKASYGDSAWCACRYTYIDIGTTHSYMYDNSA